VRRVGADAFVRPVPMSEAKWRVTGACAASNAHSDVIIALRAIPDEGVRGLHTSIHLTQWRSRVNMALYDMSSEDIWGACRSPNPCY